MTPATLKNSYLFIIQMQPPMTKVNGLHN